MFRIFSNETNEPLSNDNMTFDFQKQHNYDKRRSESLRIKAKYPDRIPIICEVYKRDRKELNLDKNKYLVPNDLSIGQFLYVIRKRIHLKPEKAIYVFTEKGTLPPTAQLISTIYKDYKSNDGFLYLMISAESTFGYG